MKFIGRKIELKKINKLIQKEEFSFALIYGRRRIGKSELVKQVLRENHAKGISHPISDPLCQFYYHNIYRYTSQLTMMNPRDFFAQYTEKDVKRKKV